MKLRLFTGLAAALMLGGCATYEYVDRGGGYYTGSSPQYRTSTYGSFYGGYGYGGYGSSYLGYRYRPGWSFGLDYGYAPSWYPYLGGGFQGYGVGYYPRPPYYRPPQVRPHPPYPGRPGQDDHRPDRPVSPPAIGQQQPDYDRTPWRNRDRLRRSPEHDDGAMSYRPERPLMQEGVGAPPELARPAGEVRPVRPADFARQYGQPRPAGMDASGESVRYRQQASGMESPRMRSPQAQPQQRERPVRQASSDSPRRMRSETSSTTEP